MTQSSFRGTSVLHQVRGSLARESQSEPKADKGKPSLTGIKNIIGRLTSYSHELAKWPKSTHSSIPAYLESIYLAAKGVLQAGSD